MTSELEQLQPVFEKYPTLKEYFNIGLDGAQQSIGFSSDDLQNSWETTYDSGVTIRFSDTQPIGIAGNIDKIHRAKSLVVLDIDDVFRDTAGSLLNLADIPYDRKTTLGYDRPFGVQFPAMTHIVSGIIIDGAVEPMQGIENMRHNLESLSNNSDVYCVAVTSAVQGTELATVDFLKQQLPGVINGISFPGNFDGKGKFTKADAIQSYIEIINSLGTNNTLESVDFIDDTPHHIADYRVAMRQIDGLLRFSDVTPEHAMNNASTEYYDEKADEVFMLNFVDSPSLGIMQILQNIHKHYNKEAA